MRISLAIDKLCRAEEECIRTFAAAFPVGATVTWMRGDKLQSGVVESTDSDAFEPRAFRVTLTNSSTGKQVRISPWSIVSVHEVSS